MLENQEGNFTEKGEKALTAFEDKYFVEGMGFRHLDISMVVNFLEQYPLEIQKEIKQYLETMMLLKDYSAKVPISEVAALLGPPPPEREQDVKPKKFKFPYKTKKGLGPAPTYRSSIFNQPLEEEVQYGIFNRVINPKSPKETKHSIADRLIHPFLYFANRINELYHQKIKK